MLEGLIKRTKRPDRRAEFLAELSGPRFPTELAYLWKIFGRLSNRRGGSGFGPLPIGWSDISAFVALSRVKLEPWEIEIIEDLDSEFLAAAGSTGKK